MPVQILKTYRCVYDDTIDTVSTLGSLTMITPKLCRATFGVGDADPPLPPLRPGDRIQIVLEIPYSDPS